MFGTQFPLFFRTLSPSFRKKHSLPVIFFTQSREQQRKRQLEKAVLPKCKHLKSLFPTHPKEVIRVGSPSMEKISQVSQPLYFFHKEEEKKHYI
ncbi:MAG: hypothetical protein ACRCU2_09110, partial [Planktothrix sp.]